MFNCFVNLLIQVKRITKVIMDIRKIVILFKSEFVIFYGFFGLFCVVVRITEANKGLKLAFIVL